MKRIPAALVFLCLLCSFRIFAASLNERVYETQIENGLSVFVLEDYSNPQIRAELCVRAGFSNQTVEDAGFFTLLANLIKKSSRLSFESVQVSSDSTRFTVILSPSELEESLAELADSVFNPNYSNALLSSEFASLKREVLLTVTDAGSMMNAGIDSRVFSSEPWRNDSGIYPQLFSVLSENDARKTLSRIQDNFFVPGNAALFVSGNISSKDLMAKVENAFERFWSNRKSVSRPLIIPGSGQRKFIIHGKDFSEDLTQIVVQYENLTEEESIIAARVYNNDYSRMKRNLCETEKLNIPGYEYVDFSAAFKSGTTRLIAQSLLQTKKNVTPAAQAKEFMEIFRESGRITFEEYRQALAKQIFEFNKTISSSSAYMEALADLWIKDPYTGTGETVAERMQNRKTDLEAVSFERISEVINDDEPFVFVILNTKAYTKCKKEFAQNGFEEINSGNASWWTDSLYKNTKTLVELSRLADKSRNQKEMKETDYSQNFIKLNEDTVSTLTLSNGIPVYMKRNENTQGVTLLVSIAGGNLHSANDYGFEEVMTNVLTMNVLRQIRQKQYEGLVLNDFEIYSETETESSRIVIECESEDFYSIINALAKSLIMDEVIPSDADRIVQGRRTRKRLENGSTVNQLYSSAVASLLPGTDYTKIFETEKEILDNTSYELILHEYPNILDPARYSLILSGNFDPEILGPVISDAFSLFIEKGNSRKDALIKSGNLKGLEKFPSGRRKNVKLVHTFLTDVPAKDAGPMPAVLIPTKSFADPILFCASAPVPGTEEYAVFNAVLPYLQEKLVKNAEEKMYLYNCKISAAKATEQLPFSAITFSSVERTSACDSLYKNTISEIKEELNNAGTSGKTIQKIKTRCVASEFGDAYTNTGCALLMEECIYESAGGNKVLNYLEKYKSVNDLTAGSVLEVIEKYLEFDSLFRLYSAEAKK